MENNNKPPPSITINEKDDDPTAANPMLYGPLHGAKISKANQYLATVILCLSAVAAGTGLAWTAPVLPQLSNLENLNTTSLYATPEEGTWIASFLAIGAWCGAIPMGILAEKIGRKKSAMVIGVTFTIGWAATVFASKVGVLYFARFVIGIATGGSCVVTPMFISEFAEMSIRGLLGTCFQLFLTIGILLVFVAGTLISWVSLSWVCGVVPVVFVVGMFFVPESPTWLLKQERHTDATLALKWFWGKYCDANAAIQEIQNDLEASGGSGTIRDLLRNPTNRKGFIISIMLMFFQQFSGINAVIFFTVDIFQMAGSTLNPNYCSIIVGVVQVLMTFAAAALVERAGRKILLIQSSAIMCLCLTVLGIYFKIKDAGTDVSAFGLVPLVSLVLFIISFSLGYGPIPWMMMGELLAPEVKGIASSIVVLFNWTSVFIVTKTFPLLLTSWGNDITFWIFAVVMVIGTIYGFKELFETKGKSNAQIQLMLSSK
ncbi:facilitated trehalose transporter Tret1 isoform X2 [Bradysia coprophila]|uniref:facilitated trehalose transporter Tret1 isoform X2 n=1 Tax=Bradysia coprophila TaxID=38358 RepID=UPI00187DB48C|nr:facilitated trehalose transporter Tret1 isoform X2 [Bradysia coprophila]